ncbi:tyrosine-type recombinase/integrase [Dialister micraerophilus]|uniref:Tyr recombinase domain-containing protein n=1 Tax=Dialister micraerophilus UPII 345-E TaxID=910314 RepID=E4L8D4_9FIRM|nr:site-specific integrase [Dialister micraerophilus]EFR42990.1 conserved hypothetical protein TIGR03982 [Dialister micraerophilus UPII 345-E]
MVYKRDNGTGSVYKKTDKPRRRPWVAYMTCGFNHDNLRRKRKLVGSFVTRKEALNALDTYRLTHTPSEISDITWNHAFDLVNNQEEFTKVVKSAWENHAKALYNMQVAKTKAAHLQSILNEAKTYGIQSNLITVFRRIYKFCISNDVVSRDYSLYLKKVSFKKSDIHQAFSTQELRSLWVHTDDDTVKVLLIMIYTGTRSVEISNLKIENIDFKKQIAIGGAKTQAGKNRIIPIADCILPFVKYFYAISKLKRYPYLIFPDINRQLFKHQNKIIISVSLKKLIERYPATGNHKPHDTRHTFATLADNYQMNPIIKKLILGHKQADLTSEVYTHKNTRQLVAAVNSLPHGKDMYVSTEEIGVATG